MAEAMRPISIRENDELIEIPMIQAVIRSLGVSAVKGSHRAQWALAQMVKAVQDRRREELEVLFNEAIAYKIRWEETIEDCDKRGLPYPDPVPHPDDMVLNSHTMEVKFNGPVGIDDKRHWDKMLERRKEALESVAELKAMRAEAKGKTTFIDEEIASEEAIADMIGGIIPDEKTRRTPGFDLQQWRERKGVLAKMKARRGRE